MAALSLQEPGEPGPSLDQGPRHAEAARRLIEGLETGRPWPLGVRVTESGVNVAVFSAHAEAIELCVFDDDGRQELARLPLPGRSGDVFHGELRGDGIGAGMVYGFRAHGPWAPAQGLRFNPCKLLLDPWAREIVGRFTWDSTHFAADRRRPQQMDRRDNAAHALKARVVDDRFDWAGDRPPHRPWHDTVLYELHVRGFTKRMPGVPEALRGTYLGLASPAAIAHLQRLGITAVELLPVQQHVDGFRFDLATVLGRGTQGFDPDGPFFKAVAQDPVLAGVKLIAEPWDLGPDGWQTGRFPAGWVEWNDRFRDTVRKFWLGGDVTRGEFARRLAGSADLFQRPGRSPLESLNYVVSHDGFTLHDLVSHDVRHNEANLEDNRDGTANNLSWNCGWEGPTTDPGVTRLRARLKRALLATLLLSQGTPMLAAGDELGHTQGGNNNPYCQDNETTWIDWSRADAELIAFTSHVLALRARLLPLAPRWYSGKPDALGRIDLCWLRRTGETPTPEQWNNRGSRCIAAWVGAPGRGNQPLVLLFNARDFDVECRLPPGRWCGELDTSQSDGLFRQPVPEDGRLLVGARSVMLLRDTSPRPAPEPRKDPR